MTCRNQSEWDNAADLPDDLPDAVCPECDNTYSRADALARDWICPCCDARLIEDSE
jgi:hypothetical protein